MNVPLYGFKKLIYGRIRFGEYRHYYSQPVTTGPAELHSPFYPTSPWNREWQPAVCLKGGNHTSPDKNCDCGIYGVYDLNSKDLVHSPGFVVVLIEASGVIIQGSKGWKAELARIVALTNKHDPTYYRGLQEFAIKHDIPFIYAQKAQEQVTQSRLAYNENLFMGEVIEEFDE